MLRLNFRIPVFFWNSRATFLFLYYANVAKHVHRWVCLLYKITVLLRRLSGLIEVFAGFKFEQVKNVIDMVAPVQDEVLSVFEKILLPPVIRLQD